MTDRFFKNNFNFCHHINRVAKIIKFPTLKGVFDTKFDLNIGTIFQINQKRTKKNLQMTGIFTQNQF